MHSLISRGLSSVTGRRARRVALASSLLLALGVIEAGSAFGQIETIIVTARKRQENVQNVPVAVTAVSGEQLQKYNLTSVEQIAQTTPQLVIARFSSGSGADITIRGIGSSAENIGIEQSVSVNVDGVYYGQGRAIDEGTFDVNNVQILKGPQALFYGKNATAGALAIQTNDPTDQYEAYVTAGYEFSAAEPYVEGVVSGPVTDDLGLRLAARFSDQTQGLFKNNAPAGVYHTFDVATGQFNAYPTANPSQYLGEDENILARFTGKWNPISDLTVTVKGTFNRLLSNNNSDNVVNTFCPLGYAQTDPTQTPCSRSFVEPQPALPLAVAQTSSFLNKEGGQDFEHYQSATLYANIAYTTANYSLTSTNAVQHLYNDWADNQNFTQAALVYAGEHFDWGQFSTEERFNTTFDYPVNFAGGVYFQSTDLKFEQDVDFAGAQNTAAPLADEFVAYSKHATTGGHTYSAFGQVIWDIIPELELTAGARYTHELKNSIFTQPYVNPTLAGLFIQYNPANPATYVTGRQRFDNLSPEATLTWKPQDNLTLYVGWKEGYKSGGFSDAAILSAFTLPSDLQFKPEKAKGVEAGVKSQWLNNQLRLNLDVFDYLYSDLQVDFFNTPTFNYITLNAASARTEGFDYQAEYAPESIEGLLLRLDGAYDDAHYGSFIAPCSPAGITYEQGCNLLRLVNPNGTYTFSGNCGTSPATCDFMNVSGGPTAIAPRWTATLGGDYDTPISYGLKLGVSANVRLSSGYIANAFPSSVVERVDRQSGYGMLDGALSLSSESGLWTLRLIGRNLTDTFVALGTQGLPLSGGVTGCKVAVCGPQLISDQGSVVAEPRTVALEFTLRY